MHYTVTLSIEHTIQLRVNLLLKVTTFLAWAKWKLDICPPNHPQGTCEETCSKTLCAIDSVKVTNVVLSHISDFRVRTFRQASVRGVHMSNQSTIRSLTKQAHMENCVKEDEIGCSHLPLNELKGYKFL